MGRVIQAHVEGGSLRGISRRVNLAYNTVVTLVRATSKKGQMIHNGNVENIKTSQVSSDEFWSFVQKKQKHCHMNELTEGDCWIGMT
ncbi:MAG: hypothetical protein MGG11_06415 [Trichodesmium sp. MAG_R03]|nr:hypothetical protein [Trichodesmium sp. MAG_R03]